MRILVMAEHDGVNVKDITLNTISAASQIGGEVDLLVVGEACSAVAEKASKITGITNVLVADNECYRGLLAENVSQLIESLAKDYSHIVAPSTANGKNLLPHVAAKLDVSVFSDIIGVVSEDTLKRSIYAGNVIATMQTTDSIKVITVRGSSFDPVSYEGNASIVVVDQVFDAGLTSYIDESSVVSERPELTSAKTVITGGRGMQNGENFSLLEAVADKLGAAVGATRAAVDAGFVPNEMQVGQTGKIVAPDLYMAVAVSGAIQHIAGMKDSKVIVAINKDSEAPIFQFADYGLVADLFDVLPELEKAL